MQTESNLDLRGPGFNSPGDFLSNLQKATFIENPLVELANSPTAVVYNGDECCSLHHVCSLLCGCPCTKDCADYYKYNTLVINGDVRKYLMKNIVRLKYAFCHLGIMNRFDWCKSYTMLSAEQFESLDAGIETAEMTKEGNCYVGRYCSIILPVHTKPNNTLVGYVKFLGFCEAFCNAYCNCCKGCCKSDCCKGCCTLCKGCCKEDCCYNYYYMCDILLPNRNLIYTIFIRKCCMDICSFNSCCCDTVEFAIKNTNFETVGEIIRKKKCNICGICGANSTYSIKFPPDATPENKLTIINAAIAIDILTI